MAGCQISLGFGGLQRRIAALGPRGASSKAGSTRQPIEAAGINNCLMGVSNMGSQTDSSGASGIEPNLGLLGRKIGMMRIFSDDGESIPVTVIDVSNNRVSQVKTSTADGYDAVQMVHGERRASRVTKAQAGHFAKAGVQAGTSLGEFHVSAEKADALKAGSVRRRGPLRRRPVHRRAGGLAGQGLYRRHQAPPLQLQPRIARQLAFAQRAGFDRHGAGSGPRVPGQEDVGPHGRRDQRRCRT